MLAASMIRVATQFSCHGVLASSPKTLTSIQTCHILRLSSLGEKHQHNLHKLRISYSTPPQTPEHIDVAIQQCSLVQELSLGLHNAKAKVWWEIVAPGVSDDSAQSAMECLEFALEDILGSLERIEPAGAQVPKCAQKPIQGFMHFQHLPTAPCCTLSKMKLTQSLTKPKSLLSFWYASGMRNGNWTACLGTCEHQKCRPVSAV